MDFGELAKAVSSWAGAVGFAPHSRHRSHRQKRSKRHLAYIPQSIPQAVADKVRRPLES